MLKMLLSLALLTGCTISINMIHTQGKADDVVDEDQSPTNDVKPSLSIPASLAQG